MGTSLLFEVELSSEESGSESEADIDQIMSQYNNKNQTTSKPLKKGGMTSEQNIFNKID